MSLRSVVPFQRPSGQQAGELIDHPVNIGSIGLGSSVKKVVVDAPGAIVGDVVTIAQRATGSLLPSRSGFTQPQVIENGKIEIGIVNVGIASLVSVGTVRLDIRWYRANQ